MRQPEPEAYHCWRLSLEGRVEDGGNLEPIGLGLSSTSSLLSFQSIEGVIVNALPAGVDGPFYDVSDPVQLKVASWRERELVRRHVDLLDARILAMRRDLELHQVTDMLDAGCTVHLVKEILL